jgi:hypothetical protein
MTEIESFLRDGTNETLLISKEFPDLSWKGIVPTPTIGYLASSPRSTCTL